MSVKRTSVYIEEARHEEAVRILNKRRPRMAFSRWVSEQVEKLISGEAKRSNKKSKASR